MPKLTKDFPDQLNFLTPEGTLDMLIAIAYFRGEGGKYAGPARDFIIGGIRDFQSRLSDADKRRLKEVLANVKIART